MTLTVVQLSLQVILTVDLQVTLIVDLLQIVMEVLSRDSFQFTMQGVCLITEAVTR